MIARVTHGMLFDRLTQQVRELQNRIGMAQERVSTQKDLIRASDDPSAAARASRLHSEGADLRTLEDAVGLGLTMLSAQDAALAQAEALLVRAREIATQHSNSIHDTEARLQAAREVEELERGLLTVANTAVGGRHVFAGLATGAPPFAQFDDPAFDPAGAYSGPADPFELRSGPDDARTRITTPGNEVFTSALVALDELRLTLEAGTTPTDHIDTLAQASADLGAERSSVGGRARRLEARSSEILDGLQHNAGEIGRTEDADPIAAIVELQRLTTALQAALQSGRVLQESLLDHLRF